MAPDVVDLRSDTVTQPTDEMRRAMAAAEVGDDCYGEDPTVNRLQEIAAAMLGCEAALYVPSGTMANQIALKVLSEPGGEVICEEGCHLIHHEAGACAVLSQVQLRGLSGRRGVLEADDVRAAVRPSDPYQPRSVLVAIENTHNAAGGTVVPVGDARDVAAAAREAGLPIFCDGARLFNAAAATGATAAEHAAPFDLVTISLYKGLAAPMGSLVCGRKDRVSAGWRFRRVFGGALRQAGIVAAAGIVALESMVDRLADDHANARRLAEGLAEAAPAGSVGTPETNMVLFDAAAAGVSADAFLGVARREGVLGGLISPTVVRLVTHKDVAAADVDRALGGLRVALKECG